MITNNYLFASQFVNYLKSKKIDQDQLLAFKSVFLSFSGRQTLEGNQNLIKDFIKQIINILQFAYDDFVLNAYKNGHFCYLYNGFPLVKKISCIFLADPQINIDSTTKGSFPVLELIQLLKKEKLEWGIMTNGTKWRLYSTLNSQPFENYFEIDFSSYDNSDFHAFYQLFSVTLFIPDEHQVTPLERFMEASEKEAKIIEDHLKTNINEILETISFGFLSYSGKINSPLSEEERQEYFNNSVFLLFRLLFIFYAESRKLLPIERPNYGPISLESMLSTSKHWLKDAAFEDVNGTDLWSQFRELCINIDNGNSLFDIPEYDGGLFDIFQHPFLNDPNHQLTNQIFAKVLYGLGYFIKGKNSIKIDYRDLSVRSLGTLYEGILEYRLFIAKEDLVLRDKKFIPKEEAGIVKKNEREIPAGNVYFSQDADERHDTGSYYTPEDVVNYIITNSVRLGLEERWLDFLPTVIKYESDIKSSYSKAIRDSLLRKFDDELLSFINNKVLTFRVIDPAMGSGHFLVDALHCITHFILEVLSTSVEISSGPIKHDKSDILIDWTLFPFASELILDPVYWRRKVVENCIFGIDLNPLASELSKLALWIASSSEGKPLTFLNHHLKNGDSILGIRIEDLLKYPVNRNSKQLNGEPRLFESLDIARIDNIKTRFTKLISLSSDEISNVFTKKEIYSEIESDLFLKHLKDVATLWLIISFNLNNLKSKTLFENNILPDENEYLELLEKLHLIDNELEWQEAIGISLYAEIQKFNHDKKIFHWDLEFPEILNLGFDAVIGNPPYVDVQSTNYMGLSFLPLTSTNLYSYILSKALYHKSSIYHIGFILPMSILVSERMKELRNNITTSGRNFFINIDSTSHPGTLFKNVNTQISIVFSIASTIDSSSIYTTNYNRFYASDRKLLFNNFICHKVNGTLIKDGFFPKIQSALEQSILEKLFMKEKCFNSFLYVEEGNVQNKENYFYYKDAGNPYYRLAFDEIPFLELNGVEQTSSTTRRVLLNSMVNKYIPICIFHSSLFYWFWIVYSDCYHFTLKDFGRFPVDLDELMGKDVDFDELFKEIKTNLKNTGKIVTYNKKQGVTRYMEYKPRYSKHIFDKVDRVLADYYGLTEEEYNFVIDYDLKFRTDEKCQDDN